MYLCRHVISLWKVSITPNTICFIQETLLGLHLPQISDECVKESNLHYSKHSNQNPQYTITHIRELQPQQLIWISPYSDYSNKLDASCVCSRELNTKDIPAALPVYGPLVERQISDHHIAKKASTQRGFDPPCSNSE